MANTRLKIAVFVSGSGTNLQAMIDAAAEGRLQAEIAVVVSNRPDAYGLVRARRHGIPTLVVDYATYGKKRMPKVAASELPANFAEICRRQRIYPTAPRKEVEERLARLVLAEKEIIAGLREFAPGLVCLAGYMRLLSPYFLSHFQGDGEYRIMNIHPALLPAFPGERGYLDTFRYGCKIGGVTVHFVDEGEDSGAVIAQAAYPIWPEDNLEGIQRRGLALEYRLYPQCINWFAAGALEVVSTGDGRPLVLIRDPTYPDFLRELTAAAFRLTLP